MTIIKITLFVLIIFFSQASYARYLVSENSDYDAISEFRDEVPNDSMNARFTREFPPQFNYESPVERKPYRAAKRKKVHVEPQYNNDDDYADEGPAYGYDLPSRI